MAIRREAATRSAAGEDILSRRLLMPKWSRWRKNKSPSSSLVVRESARATLKKGVEEEEVVMINDLSLSCGSFDLCEEKPHMTRHVCSFGKQERNGLRLGR